MEFRYMGFDQDQNTRSFKFDVVFKDRPAYRLVVAADLLLFVKHGIGFQEGPALCARKLSSNQEGVRQSHHQLTNEDLLEFASARTAAQERKAALRKLGFRRRAAAAPGG